MISRMQVQATSAEQTVKRLEWKYKDIERDRDAKGKSLSQTQVICENVMQMSCDFSLCIRSCSFHCREK